MTAEQKDERSAEEVGKDGEQDDRGDSPDDDGMPLPLPDGVKEAQRMVAEVFKLRARHRELAGVEEVDAEFYEGQEEQQMQRGDEVGADLRGGLAELEGPGEKDDEEGGDADGGIDADDHADGEAPGQATRGDAAAQEAQQRSQGLAAEELSDWVG